MPTPHEFENLQKSRTGLNRLRHATGYSLRGMQAGWQETAFRQEVLLAVVLVPLAFWLGQTWVEIALLAGSAILLMIVELLNSAVEAAIDRIGPEWHELSGKAKDLGSAAVLLALMLTFAIWIAAFWHRFTS